MTKKRKAFLQELLIGVYKTYRLSFKDDEVNIIGKSIFDNCDLSNNKSRAHSYEQYERLLNATFFDSKTIWNIDTDGNGYNPTKAAGKVINQTQFSVITAIDNAFAFLKSIGVNFDIFFKNKPMEIEGIRDIIYRILLEILYVIFFWRVAGNLIVADDDISFLLRYQITRINSRLIRKACEINGSDFVTPDNSLVELGSDRINCNRFIYVTNDDLGIQFNVSISASKIESYIINKKEIKNTKPKIDSSGYRWLMSKLGVYSPSDNMVYRMFSLPATIDSSNNSLYYTVSYPEKKFISNIQPDPWKTIRFEIYYLFNLDENKIKALFSDIQSPHDLRSAIIHKAYSELLGAYKQRIVTYLNDVLLYIEDVISCTMVINPEKLITGVIDKETVSVFNIDYDTMISFYKNNNVIDEANLYLYMMIDGALQDFQKQLYNNSYCLANSVLEHIEHNRIKEHMEKLNSFVTSDMIKKAIAIQDKDEKDNPSAYRLGIDKVDGEELIIESYKKKTSGLFQSLFNSVSNYYLLLKSNIKE